MSGICYIIAEQYWEAWGLFWKRSVSLCFLGVFFWFRVFGCLFCVLLSCFLCLLVTPRFLSHFFSHTGELSIKTKRIDDRLSFKRARHRQKKKTDCVSCALGNARRMVDFWSGTPLNWCSVERCVWLCEVTIIAWESRAHCFGFGAVEWHVSVRCDFWAGDNAHLLEATHRVDTLCAPPGSLLLSSAPWFIHSAPILLSFCAIDDLPPERLCRLWRTLPRRINLFSNLFD